VNVTAKKDGAEKQRDEQGEDKREFHKRAAPRAAGIARTKNASHHSTILTA
jgi:hypothetical protein